MAVLSDYLPLILGLIVAGSVAGFAAGLFGIGGGIVIVPVLFFTFSALGYTETAMHSAVGTSLATIILTSIRSVLAHHDHGAVDWKLLRLWALWIMIGAICGMLLAGQISGRGMTMVFAFFAFLIALQFYFGRPDWRLADDLPGGALRAALGWLLGLVSALMGIGGGAMGVTLMTVFGRPIHSAVATASGFGLAIGLPGALAAIAIGRHRDGLPPVSLGYVNLLAFALIASMTLLSAPLGARLAHRLNAHRLKRLFAIILALAALNMLRQSIAG